MKPFDPRLLRVSPQSRPAVLVLGGLGIAQGAATVGQALAVAALVSRLVDGPSLGPALMWVGVAFAVRALLSAGTEAYAARAGAAISTGLREQLLTRWLTRSSEDRPDGDRALVLATQGSTAVEPYVARFLPTLVSAAALPALALVTMAVIDPISALVGVLTLPLLPLFAALIGRSTAEDTDRRWATLTQLSGHFLDVVRGLPTLVSYGRARAQVRTIGTVSQRHRVSTMRTLRLAFLSSAAMELLATLSVAIVAVAVGLRLAHGSMALLPGLAAILLAPEVYWPVRRVGAEFHSSVDGAQALAEILDELELATSPRAASCAAPRVGLDQQTRPAAVLSGVCYTYPGSTHHVLRGLDAQVPPRGMTVVTGPSGVGKSTLLDLLAGVRRADAGELTTAPAHLVTQRPFITAASVADNLRLAAPGAADEQLWDALAAVDLDDLLHSRDDAGRTGLDLMLGDDGFGLSAGQRARLGLARALLTDAPLLLLDEPTAHLDRRTAERVHGVIADQAGRRAVVVVTHREELAQRADHRIALPVLESEEAQR